MRRSRTYRLDDATIAVLDELPPRNEGGASGLVDRAIARLSAELNQAIAELREAGWTDEQILRAIDAGPGPAIARLPAAQWRAVAALGREPLARVRLERSLERGSTCR